jgi:hypothetical protein
MHAERRQVRGEDSCSAAVTCVPWELRVMQIRVGNMMGCVHVWCLPSETPTAPGDYCFATCMQNDLSVALTPTRGATCMTVAGAVIAAKFKTRREAPRFSTRLMCAWCDCKRALTHVHSFGGKNTPTGICLARETAGLGRGGPVPRAGGPGQGGWRGSHAR